MNKYDRNNFHKHTFCVFTEVTKEAISQLKSNYKSKSGSLYFFTEEGVFRVSNHWGRAANCKWRLQSSDKKTVNRERIGFAKWSEFHADNDSEKLYFIEVDFESKTVNYQHKSNLKPDANVVLRTASETEKIIRQIRNLFASDNWAKHFSIEINELRESIITAFINSDKTLQQIKSEFLNK